MPSTSLLTLTCSVLLLAATHTAAQEVIDLFDRPHLSRLHISAYNPRITPQVRCLRSDAEATDFCKAAWGEENAELHVDFANEQILVVAWGALRWAEGSAGAGTTIVLERATIHEDTLSATVATVIPPGPGIDIATDAPGRTWYPSLFVRTPRTERVVVDVTGARRHASAPDFRPVTTPELEVRIAPDASPSRERMLLVPQQETLTATTPKIVRFDHGDQTVVELAWGEFGPGAYHLDLVGMHIDRGVARLTVRANNRRIVFYSGPGVHRPGLALTLPRVDKVLLHIERVGMTLPATEPDFEAETGDQLEVTVDRSMIRDPR